MSIRSTNYALSPAAAEDFREILEYVRDHSGPMRAEKLAGDLRRGIETIAAFPKLGHFRDDLTDEPFRFWSVHSFLIVYDPEPRPVQVVRILHAARDAKEVLKQ